MPIKYISKPTWRTRVGSTMMTVSTKKKALKVAKKWMKLKKGRIVYIMPMRGYMEKKPFAYDVSW